MKNMNKKAKAFQDMLDKEESKAFTIEAVADDAAHAVAFRSRLVVQGQQLPFMVVLDDSIYAMLRTVVVPQAAVAGKRAGVLEYLNAQNQKYKVFKYYADEAGNILLDCCIPAADENFAPDMVRVIINVILQQLEQDYPELMKVIWGGKEVLNASPAAAPEAGEE